MLARLNIVLLLALIASAGYLVQTSYEARRLFAELERERSAAQRLGQDGERLQIERRAQATHLRVEQVVRERLQMRNSSPAVTTYVEEAAAAAAPAGAQP
jgi:cell division protein FtsL